MEGVLVRDAFHRVPWSVVGNDAYHLASRIGYIQQEIHRGWPTESCEKAGNPGDSEHRLTSLQELDAP